jgi:hypothetical protein
MPMNPQTIMHQLRSFTPRHCENCGLKHLENDFSYVGQRDGSYLFQISCNRCGSLQLLRMQPGVPGVSLQKMLNNTDVKGSEFAKFAGKPVIGKEEALEVYIDMEGVETLDDFLQLLTDAESTLVN